jgi:hypothetical protein
MSPIGIETICVRAKAMRFAVMSSNHREHTSQSLECRVEITAVRSRSPRCQEPALTTECDGAGRCGRTAKRPVFRASDRAPTVTELTRSRANTEAFGPKVPPVSQASAPGRAVLTAIEAPRLLPETVAPKR